MPACQPDLRGKARFTEHVFLGKTRAQLLGVGIIKPLEDAIHVNMYMSQVAAVTFHKLMPLSQPAVGSLCKETPIASASRCRPFSLDALVCHSVQPRGACPKRGLVLQQCKVKCANLISHGWQPLEQPLLVSSKSAFCGVQENGAPAGVGKVSDGDKADVSRFLNRLLGLEPEWQTYLFDFYQAVMEYVVAEAKREGKFEDGIVDFRATSVVLKGAPRVRAPHHDSRCKLVVLPRRLEKVHG